ncbi:hypothetical protein [Dyadobacter sp. CY312]|uniref:hypothetical protein n=1 Tax=Dyadobacter sp. CY312 TaxID=2907303 RepID=UPI001F173B59|nr:hypothetical protein [Dyadobacter sp. CY312]MCE7042011.1 hypothetical protein [Dyadobacter sp. CY312]
MMESYIKETNFKRDDVIKEIISFVSLNHSWDGYEAVPLEVESAANAIMLTNQLSDNVLLDKLTNLYPNPHGTISFEWENESNEILSLEVGNTSFSYYVQFNSAETQQFDNISIMPTEISKLASSISLI